MVKLDIPSSCARKPFQYLLSQTYLIIVAVILFLVAWSAKKQPFVYKDGKYLFITTMIILPIYLSSIIIIESLINRETLLITSHLSKNIIFSDVIISLSMIFISTGALLGIFGPLLYTIHKYGVMQTKNGSYAESLSSAFILFQGVESQKETLFDQFSFSSNSNEGTKPKFFFEANSNKSKSGHKGLECHTKHKFEYDYTLNGVKGINHLEGKEMIRNPFYEDEGFKSAYP